jgi:hypothetical protein
VNSKEENSSDFCQDFVQESTSVHSDGLAVMACEFKGMRWFFSQSLVTTKSLQDFLFRPTFFYCNECIWRVPSNRVISSLEGKFSTVGDTGDTFVLVLEPLFMKISNLCKNHLLMA